MFNRTGSQEMPWGSGLANGEDAVMDDGTETHQAEINKKIKANEKLRKILTNMPEEHRTLIYGDSFKSKMESLDDEELEAATAKQIQAKQEMVLLVAEQSAENARTVNQGNSGFQSPHVRTHL